VAFDRLQDLPRGQFGNCRVHNADLKDDTIRPGKLDRRYTYEQFEVDPVTSKRLGGAATGTAGDVNLAHFPETGFEWHVKGTQDILAPVLTASGWDINQDQTSGDGIEITQGITARSPGAFVVGTDPAFFFAATLKVADASGATNLFVGFRKAEGYQADEDNYDEMAAIGINGTADPNTIKLATILNNAATTSTDTTDTWADAAEKTLKVLVSAAGAVTYQINGSAPTTVAAFTFDAGEVVVPFIYFVNGGDVAGAVELSAWECGLQRAETV
jgi:hypothetical protein